jgi:hypothetical protein
MKIFLKRCLAAMLDVAMFLWCFVFYLLSLKTDNELYSTGLIFVGVLPLNLIVLPYLFKLLKV